MRSRIIGALLFIGSLLALILSITLIGRALLFASHTSSLVTALIGTALGAASLFFTFKLLGETAEHAENGKKEILFKKPAISVAISFAGSLASLHFAGLSIPDFLQWLMQKLPI